MGNATELSRIAMIMNPSARVRSIRGLIGKVFDGIEPLINLYRPYVDGLECLPRDGRFLLVGNHTQSGAEVWLTSYFVRREIGTLVRPLAVRMMGDLPGLLGDVFSAYGAVVGAPETAQELMRHDQSILVFPGGGREIAKFKGEEYMLHWEGRAGFARLSVQNQYPIVPVALVGGDDVYKSVISRTSRLGQLNTEIYDKLTGRRDMAPPIGRGVGLTPLPHPRRMYLRFAQPIDTRRPKDVPADAWVTEIKNATQTALESALADLLSRRRADPYRELNPLSWRNAIPSPGQA